MPTMNDYERRFQRSLQKLTVPPWYIENMSSNQSTSSKQSLLSTTPSLPWKNQDQEPPQTPEIVHIRRPHSYRSCRSSLAASPSPSIHSWHPNHFTDGGNLSFLVPSKSTSSSATRRHQKYEKGIERVTKSSQWYRPTTFTNNKSPKDQTVIERNISTSKKNNHYHTPKIRSNDENLILVTETSQELSLVNEPNNNMIINEKQQDNHIKSNESSLMPLANQKEEIFNQIILEEITDDDDDDINDEELQHTANDLVESVLTEISRYKTFEEIDDQNSGVRELSEDESGLRELDENDINNTDEFILLATKAEISDDEQTSNLPRINQNKLYTFSKINDQISPNLSQNLSRSILEKDVKTTTTTATNESIDQIFFTSPIYQKDNQNKHIDNVQYPSYRQLPSTCQSSSEGVNEETARIGRLLLNQIPISLIENIRHLLSNHEDDYQLPITTEYDEDISDQVRHDSAYSSNQERIDLPQSIYEPLSECYSGYTYVQSDFLTTNLSSIQTTTDEAYESEPTTMCSSIATTTHVHPDLEHEFEYPSPPPPVPDRRLKPNYLKAQPTPPPVKPRLTRQENIDTAEYSIVQKNKLIPIKVIQHLLNSTCDESFSSSTRRISSRHYCGSIPVTNEMTQTIDYSSSIKINDENKDKTKDKRTGRTLSCLHPSTTDESKRENPIRKSSSSSLNKTKFRKQKVKPDFDEATNGLAIRLPAPQIKPTTPKTTTTKRTNLMPSNRPSYYETSV